MYGLDLFSGIGGLAKGLEDFVTPIAYCEIDRYCRGVLLSRQASEDLESAPIWDDVRSFDGKPFNGCAEIITAGFPCQDISVGGRGEGLEGESSGLFFEVMRIVDEVRPRFVFLENVPAITLRGLGEVATELTRRRYDCRWTMLSAATVGAPHKRRRWFLLAHAASIRVEECGTAGEQESCIPSREKLSGRYDAGQRAALWPFEPSVARLVHGAPCRVDRVRALGNAVVPEQARIAFMELAGL